MERIRLKYIMLVGFFLFLAGAGSMNAYGQQADSLKRKAPKELELLETPVDTATLALKMDSAQRVLPKAKKRFIPNANKATWLAIAFPGA